MTIGLLLWLGPSPPLEAKLDTLGIVGNLLLLPVNYFMFMDSFSLFIP